jgi:two-component system, chemotaxis family, CheB/CheR fusion protein
MKTKPPIVSEELSLALPDFPVAGIGASAGGLATFEAFFSGLPKEKTGMAFVLVQHLAPDHKSHLTELVRRYTKMQVFEVEDGMSIKPDCVYIIPPGCDMELVSGKLQLLQPAAPRGHRMPIDFFFRSLARDRCEKAIGIILSGSGSDGTLGVRAIKAEGGMVMAQNPASAEYDSMPRNAIATGLVDYELPPAEMPAQLVAYVAHTATQTLLSDTPLQSYAPAILQKLYNLLKGRTGHDFTQYKPGTLQRRIQRRMAVHRMEALEAYTEYAEKKPGEVEALFRDLLIGVTHFFRDTEAFAALETQVIPKLFAGRLPGGLVRVWVPGCSSGEEAYSIAILLYEHAETLKQGYRIQIFATDIDSRAISIARSGIYPGSIATDVSPERLARFFTSEPHESAFRISKNIRDLVIFSEQDIVRDPPFSKLDLVSCRNLLIYMGHELQKKLIPLFHYALNPSTFLFLGTSEGIGDFGDLFLPLDRKLKLYQAKLANHTYFSAVSARRLVPTLRTELLPQHGTAVVLPVKLPLRELTEKALLQYLNPTAVLVNAQGDIFYLHGRTGLYLEPAPGEISVSNVLKIAREGLRRDLAAALHQAAESREITKHQGVRVKTNGDYTLINLTIKPVIATTNEAELFVIIFEKAAATPGSTTDATAAPPKQTDAGSYIAALKKELHTKEEYLQSANEELETSNEELKSSVEEMQSINEELQSTNEELETSKEELQSVNEELATVNAELQTKVVDLSRANNDLNNLLAGTGIGTIFVDHKLNIVRFTPAATQIINLIQSDIGRPVSHIVSNLADYQALVSDTQQVLETLVSKELEVQTKTGVWYALRIMPYRTLDNVIEGAVITFVNISEIKKVQETLRLSEHRIRVALHASPITIFNQDRNLRYTWIHNANPDFSPEQILGKTDLEIYPGADGEALSTLKRQILISGAGTRQQIRTTKAGRVQVYDLTIEPLRNTEGAIIGITCASVENTEAVNQGKQHATES